MPILYFINSAMHQPISISTKSPVVLLLISLIIRELSAFNHDTESSLGTFMTKSPESTDAPPGM